MPRITPLMSRNQGIYQSTAAHQGHSGSFYRRAVSSTAWTFLELRRGKRAASMRSLQITGRGCPAKHRRCT